MHENKIKNVIKLNSNDRYGYSIREFVKLEKIWVLSHAESLITFVDQKNNEVFLIWPHKEVAEHCILEEIEVDGYSIEAIDYDEFKNLCIPDMINDKILFGVFYDDKREGMVISGEDLLKDLEAEEDGDF
jgi:hypothetical protein